MAKKARRTLVKSPPEVWQLIDDEARVGPWLSELGAVAGEIEAIERQPEEIIVWRRGPAASLAFEISGKGWGTHVEIDASGGADEAAILESILDELATPERRPFSNG
jgi:hypothetical protein